MLDPAHSKPPVESLPLLGVSKVDVLNNTFKSKFAKEDLNVLSLLGHAFSYTEGVFA